MVRGIGKKDYEVQWNDLIKHNPVVPGRRGSSVRQTGNVDQISLEPKPTLPGRQKIDPTNLTEGIRLHEGERRSSKIGQMWELVQRKEGQSLEQCLIEHFNLEADASSAMVQLLVQLYYMKNKDYSLNQSQVYLPTLLGVMAYCQRLYQDLPTYLLERQRERSLSPEENENIQVMQKGLEEIASFMMTQASQLFSAQINENLIQAINHPGGMMELALGIKDQERRKGESVTEYLVRMDSLPSQWMEHVTGVRAKVDEDLELLKQLPKSIYNSETQHLMLSRSEKGFMSDVIQHIPQMPDQLQKRLQKIIDRSLMLHPGASELTIDAAVEITREHLVEQSGEEFTLIPTLLSSWRRHIEPAYFGLTPELETTSNTAESASTPIPILPGSSNELLKQEAGNQNIKEMKEGVKDSKEITAAMREESNKFAKQISENNKANHTYKNPYPKQRLT